MYKIFLKFKTKIIVEFDGRQLIYKTSQTIIAMTTYYPQCLTPQTCNFPLMVSEWGHVENIYTAPIVHLPIAVVTSQFLASICPYTGALITAESLVHTVPIARGDVMPLICNNNNYPFDFEINCENESESPPNEVHSKVPIEADVIPAIYENYSYSIAPKLNYEKGSQSSATELQNDKDQYFMADVAKEITDEMSDKIKNKESNVDMDPVEQYLRLPQNLFPKAKMLSINPNPIIDQLCKLEHITENVSWILDLEFGVPRVAVTRTIATYDVKFNSIHCKNTPNAIHPGFEKCNSDFKRTILFYYDGIVSNWYNGYIVLKNDKSVENFQSWLSIPMQMFGMCWP